jgi:hypothetical protein
MIITLAMNRFLIVYKRIYHIYSQTIFVWLWSISFATLIVHYPTSIMNVRYFYITFLLSLYFIIQILCIKYIHKQGLTVPLNTGLNKTRRRTAIGLFVISLSGIIIWNLKQY